MFGMCKRQAERLADQARCDGWGDVTVELVDAETARERFAVVLGGEGEPGGEVFLFGWADYADFCERYEPCKEEEPAGAFGYWPGEDARPLSRAQREGLA